MDDVKKLMIEQLRDAYSAEKQALRAMARMQKRATAQPLKEAIQTHIEQTEGQVERLERGLEMLGGKPGRKVCEGMRGIIEEGQSEVEEHDKGPVGDVLIVASMQRVEHDEIAAYGTMVALARAAGEAQLAELLGQTLAEEKQTDELLTRMAESEINPAMLEAAEPANDQPKRGGRGRAA
jgi:ferritin-like metal-binding protein YciE